jgi:glycosyl transferase family 25
MFSKVLIINLEKDKKRLENITQNCKDRNLDAIRIEAINGREISDNFKRVNSTHFCYNFCTPGMMGCWLSHRKCWQYIVDNNIDNCLILEDDAEFVEDFNEKMNIIESNIPEDYDILLLGHACTCSSENCTKLQQVLDFLKKKQTNSNITKEKINKYIYRPDVFTGTHGYIISNKGARKCLQYLYLADGHVDLGLNQKNNVVNIYSTVEKYIYQKATSDNTTQHKNFPKNLNKFADKLNDDNIGLGFLLSTPYMKVGNYIINFWTVIFFIFGLILCLFPQSIKILFLSLFLLLMSIEYFDNSENLHQIFGTILVVLIGCFLTYRQK